MSELQQSVEQEKSAEGVLEGHEAHRLLTYRPLGSEGGVGVWWELRQAAKLFGQPELSLWAPRSERIDWKIDEQGGAEIRFRETTIGVMFHGDRGARGGMRAGETSLIKHDLTFRVAPEGKITSVTTTGEKEETVDLEQKIAERRSLHAGLIQKEPDSDEVEAHMRSELPDQKVMMRLITKLKEDGGKVPLGAWAKDWLKRKVGDIKDSLV